jgi:HD-like signal output (HDOD) protein
MYARHPIAGAIIAARCGMPDDIVNTIACHAKEGDGAPKVLETVLIHQADFATFDPLVMMEKGQLIV